MKRVRLFALLSAVAVMAAGGVTVASSPGAAFAADDFLRIENVATGMCLQPVDGSIDAGAAIVQVPCGTDPAQGWSFRHPPRHTLPIVITNERSGLCLDARGGAANGTPIQQWPCVGISNESWDTPGDDSQIYALRSFVGGFDGPSYCVDVPNQQAISGLAMQLYRCNGTAAQAWAIGIGIVVQS